MDATCARTGHDEISVSPDGWRTPEELHPLRSPQNARRLLVSISRLESRSDES
ncbi:hypothetical protein AB0M43_23455 [Longispora sp. NPDC051575]|uniref:hypothetical protein n=1 Tax=Longispora sp. NPDC051575 TaxID=3154943 RepID=UPI00342A3AE6